MAGGRRSWTVSVSPACRWCARCSAAWPRIVSAGPVECSAFVAVSVVVELAVEDGDRGETGLRGCSDDRDAGEDDVAAVAPGVGLG